MGILSHKTIMFGVAVLSMGFSPIQSMAGAADSASISPRAASISAAHSELEGKEAMRALQRHIQKNNYKVSHECVTNEVVARKIVDSFPHERAKRVFNNFISQSAQKSFDSLSFRYITLIGAPGTGKTTIGHAVGHLIANCQVVEVVGEHFLNKYKNSCHELLNKFFRPFKQAKCPIIIIIDEFDKTLKKTQTKEFSDKDFLHLFLRELDNLPNNILVILTGNDEIDWSDAAFANDRFSASQFIIPDATLEQRKIALKRIIDRDAKTIQLTDSEQELLLSAIQSFNLRKIDQLFWTAKNNKQGSKVTYKDCIEAVAEIKSHKKSVWHRLALQFKSNETFRYFVYGVSASALLAGTNLLYQHINYHYFIEPANQARHAESLAQQAAQHAENVSHASGAALGGVIGGIGGLTVGAAGIASVALIGAKGGAILGLKIEALTGGASAGIITASFTIGGGIGGGIGYFVGPWLKAKVS